MGLKREEAQLIREIKAEAKKNNTAGAKAMAKSLVRLRGQMTKLLAAKGQLKGVQTQITVSRLHGMLVVVACCYKLSSTASCMAGQAALLFTAAVSITYRGPDPSGEGSFISALAAALSLMSTMVHWLQGA